MKVLALDFGSARTGVAVSDPTGTLARPLEVVKRAGTARGLARIAALASEQQVGRVVVGLPLTPSGKRGEQAEAAEQFVEQLRASLTIPVETFDERFTTKLAARRRSEGGAAEEDALAAAYLLTDYLTWTTGRA